MKLIGWVMLAVVVAVFVVSFIGAAWSYVSP